MDRFRLSAALGAALLLASAAAPAWAGGQISLDNRTTAAADMYIDGAYGCRALSGLMCTSQTAAGSHNLEAKLTDGRSITDATTLDEGDSITWTISEQ